MIPNSNFTAPIALLIEMERDYPELCVQKKRPSAKDYTCEEYIQITNGCGSKTFRPWMYNYFKNDCRVHDFNYAIGFTWWHRIKADFILFLLMVLTCLELTFTKNPWISIRCWLMCPVYFILLLFSGWYTFSQYHYDGSKQQGYASHMLVMMRYKCRVEELNPRASRNERNRK